MLIRRETWATVPGFDDMYRVSSFGRVASVRVWKRVGVANYGKPRLLAQFPNEWGHLFVRFWSDGKTTSMSVGKVMLLSFKGPSPVAAKKWACHFDGNCARNVLANLYWGTNSENQMDRVRHGTSNRGSANGKAKLEERDVLAIKARIKSGERNKAIHADYQYVDYSVISSIRIGRQWAHL